MGVVFLLIRIFFGGYFAYQAARYLSPYGRPSIVAQTGVGSFAIVTAGLLMLIGGVSIITGVFIPLGVSLLVMLLLVASLRRDGIHLAQNMALAAGALLFLAIPRPWQFTFLS